MMILFPKPQDGLMIAVDKTFNCIPLPQFSNVRIEDGHLTVQVEFKNQNFTRAEMMEHLHDGQLRIMGGHDSFPYKFQGFEHAEATKKFRITSGELKNWTEHAREATNLNFHVQAQNGDETFSSKTHANLALLDTLEKAQKALEYYKANHADDYKKARSQNIQLHEGWRYSV